MFRSLLKQDIQSLRIFVAVAECRGITAAQDRLNVSQSLISTSLLDLEYRLGFVLCKRGRGRFSLTKEGEEVYEFSLRLFDSVEQFVNQVRAIKNPELAHLNIAIGKGLPESFTTSLASTFAQLYQNNTGLNMQMDEKPSIDIERAVELGNLDVGIGSVVSSFKGLAYEKIHTEEQAIFCHKNHPLIKKNISIAALDEMGWVQNNEVMNQKLPIPMNEQNITAVANSHEGTLSFILAGTHIGYLPVSYAQKWVDQGVIEMLLPEKTHFLTEYHLIYKKQAGNQVQQFVDMMKKHH